MKVLRFLIYAAAFIMGTISAAEITGNPPLESGQTVTGGTLATPNDAQIAGILQAADTAELDAAKYAQSHALSRDVKAFARQMSVDHRDTHKKAEGLMKKDSIAATPNETSTGITTDGKTALDNFKTLKGKDFDKAYLASQIEMHRKLLDAIDRQLLPNAQSVDLKTHLQTIRPKIQAHLQHAEDLQAKISK